MADGGKLRVGLLFGGRSAEHPISIRSAQSVAEAIDRSRFELTLLAIDRTGRWLLHDDRTFAALKSEAGDNATMEVVPVRNETGVALLCVAAPERGGPQLDVVFPVLHGPYGEDGTLQGMLEMLGLPYVGCGVLGSAVGMDKDVQKRLLDAAGLPVIACEVVTRLSWQRDPAAVAERVWRLGSQVFVKPANLGSSVGVSRVDHVADLGAAVEAALSYDTKIVVERAVDAREIECAVLGNDEPRASVTGEIIPEAEFYSFEAKYNAGSQARLLIPAPIPDSLAAEMRELACKAFQVTECTGMARVDFFLERGTDSLYINELNTIPGFTSISMYPKLWEASGLPYAELITALIELAVERHSVRRRLLDTCAAEGPSS